MDRWEEKAFQPKGLYLATDPTEIFNLFSFRLPKTLKYRIFYLHLMDEAV
jgi:hypothetical protein